MWRLGVALSVVSSAVYAQPTEAKLAEAQRLYEEGEAFYKLQQYEEALARYEKAYLLSSEPTLLFNMGQCYRLLGRPADALKRYRTYLEEVPDSPERESIERLIRQMEEFVARGLTPADLEKAARLFDEAEVLYQVQKFSEALPLYSESYRLSKEPALLYNMGQCYRQLERYDEALRSYRAFLRENPSEEDRALAEKFIAEIEAIEPFPVHLVLYSGAGALTVFAGVFGGIALSNNKNALALVNVEDPTQINDETTEAALKARGRARTTALVSDVCLGLAVGSAISGVLFRTITKKKPATVKVQPSSIEVSFQW